MDFELINADRFNSFLERQPLEKDKQYYTNDLFLRAYTGNRKYTLGNESIYFDYESKHDPELDVEKITIKFK